MSPAVLTNFKCRCWPWYLVFDEKFLANPANGFAKSAFLDSWEILVPKHPKLELVKIPDSRMLVLDDQPKLADDAITRFIGKLDHTKQKVQ
jgi:hypothetical protein